MEHGVVKVRLMKCSCQGPSRVGKTHVKHLLLGIKLQPRKSTESTGCADNPVQAVSVNKIRGGSHKKWEIVDEKKLLQMLAEEIKLRGEEKLSRPRSVVAPPQEVHRALKTSANISRIEDSQHLVSSAEESPTSLAIKELGELLQHIPDAKGSPEISGHQWMYFIDSGGQPQFQ